MSINRIEQIYAASYIFCPQCDSEEEKILRRLSMYGIKGCGIKSIDKAKLHEIEVREAKKEDTVSSKFLTVSKNEQEKIQKKKKDKKIETNPKAYPNSAKGAKILGEQLYLAIKMKKEIDEKLKSKKKNNTKI